MTATNTTNSSLDERAAAATVELAALGRKRERRWRIFRNVMLTIGAVWLLLVVSVFRMFF